MSFLANLRSGLTAFGLGFGLICTTSLAQSIPLGPFGEPPDPIPVGTHEVLDNVQSGTMDCGQIPIRPMEFADDNTKLYVVNVHNSKVRCFDFAGGGIHDWQVPWAPVSLAVYQDWLIVVCGGTHGAVVLDRHTGTALEFLPLPFEPADILIRTDRAEAYVSCAGADTLAVIDLSNFSVTEFPLNAKHPAHLSFDNDQNVLIAPMISGNNTMPSDVQLEDAVILDLNDSNISPFGLPDEDLFRFNPSDQSITAVARGMGTLLFGHGVHPGTGEFWQLNFDSFNTLADSEAELRGVFGENRLTRVTLPVGAGPPVEPTALQKINLDDADPATPGVQYVSGKSVALPTGLHFVESTPNNYLAAVTGLASDNITLLDATGTRIGEWALPEGTLPRQILTAGTMAFVYGWGTNKVEWYDVSQLPPTPILSLDIGFDPTPDIVKRGRKIFFDARNSLHENVTCGSCHVDGRTDFLVWNLSESPFDEKGPLVTQTLKGIDAQAPFHWRGERPALEDFDPAFDFLLGGQTLAALQAELDAAGTDTDGTTLFEEFEAYVFSLKTPANPFQHEDNVVSDEVVLPHPSGLQGSALAGQLKFRDQVSLNSSTCIDCHQLPTGTDSDIVADAPKLNPATIRFKPTAFNEMWRKDLQPIVNVDLVGSATPHQRPMLGTGLLHDGLLLDSFTFIQPSVFQGLDAQDAADIAAYVQQIPNQNAPAVHQAVLYDPLHLGASARIANYLIPQAELGFVDLIALGTFPLGGTPTEVDWVYRPTTQLFEPSDDAFASKSWSEFVIETNAGLASNLFLGVPLGTGQQMALDADGDALYDGNELAAGTNPYAVDSDGDDVWDGFDVEPLNAGIGSDNTLPEVQSQDVVWVNTKNARIILETTEPCVLEVDYFVSGGPMQTVVTHEYETQHSLILPNLVPSTFAQTHPVVVSSADEVINEYIVEVTAIDAAGNESLPMAQPTTFDSGGFKVLFGTVFGVIGEMNDVLVARNYTDGTMALTFDIRMESKLFRDAEFGTSWPLGSMVAVCQVIVNGGLAQEASSGSTGPVFSPSWSNVSIGGNALPPIPFTGRPGPFLLTAETDGTTGTAQMTVIIENLNVNDEVVINPIAVQQVTPLYNPADAEPVLGSVENEILLGDTSFPDTDGVNRLLKLRF